MSDNYTFGDHSNSRHLTHAWVCSQCGQTVEGSFHACPKSQGITTGYLVETNKFPPLPTLLQRIEALERRVAELEKRSDERDTRGGGVPR